MTSQLTLLLLSIFAAVLAAWADTDCGTVHKSQKPWEVNPLLPKETVPLNYDIFLDPHIDEGEFFGRLNISLNLSAATDHVILHSKSLNVTSTRLFTDEEVAVPVKCAFEYAPNEFWVVVLSQTVNPGKYKLRLDFTGSLAGSLVGFYRSSYKKKDGSLSYIATTKFEPTYARRAFPCFDEPAFKATYSVKLVRPAKGGYIALSNMHKIGEEEDYPQQGKVTVKFAETPRMSTYLACFIVCDFDHLPPVVVENSGTPLTVYAREGQLENAKYARQTALEVLTFFNDYFEMQYPLPKLDLIAVPDFVSGAMENWGLITFRESRMLAGPQASAKDLLSTSNVVAHELAHMWFGDIVTMGWWDDIWLNEGFATFLANAVQAKLMPNFPVQAAFALQYLQYVMVDDAAVSSHPIIRPLTKPDQITEAFDAISYQKGSSILRMIEDFDPEGFRKAVVRYLDAHKYKNANTSDLWAELTVEYKAVEDVTRMLDTWTKQMGFPLVQVERKPNTLKLKQVRCLSNVNVKFDESSSKFGYKWDIPLKYISSANKKNPKSLVMKMEETVVVESLPEGVSWVKLNPDQVGYYRVNYEDADWENFEHLLTENVHVMSAIDRASLIDDSFSLAKAGYINYRVPLNLIGYLKNGQEKEWAPWETLSKYFSQLRDLLSNSEEASEDLKAYFRKLVTPSVKDELWNVKTDDLPNDRYVNSAIVNLACKVGVEGSITKANQLFRDWISGGKKPEIDIRDTVLVHGIKGDNLKANWMDLWKMYQVEEDPLNKEILQSALTSVSDPEIIDKLLEFAKNESLIRSQDYFSVLFGLTRTPERNDIVWEWTKNNWNYLIDRFTLNHRQFGQLLPVIARRFYTEARLSELTNFMEQHPEEGAGAVGRRKAVEIVKANIILYNDFQPVIKDILKKLVD